MRVLIGFEESQAVCIAFHKRGHEAYSCDLEECSGDHPEWHLKMDIFKALYLMDWDFIGLHPVCTKMALSGNRHYGVDKPKHQERLDAVEWTINLWDKACDKAEKVYMENPMSVMNGDNRLPEPQIIQPFYFGDEFQKTTCLWLKNLPPLFHAIETDMFNDKITHVGRGEFKEGANYRMPKWFSDNKSAKIRSKTFPGISNAMAEQWG